MFHAPWYLLLLILMPLFAWRQVRPRTAAGLRFSSTSMLDGMSRSWRQRLLWVPPAIAGMGFLLLVLALAQPREGRERTITESEGIAIEMVVDRSSSMRAMDFQIEEQNVDRLTAIKRVASEFVEGKPGSQGRISDLIGLITFAGYADARTPPTLDHGYLISGLYDTSIVLDRNEDGTAIGDAIALAVEKLNSLDNDKSVKEKVQSKVIILLTDGENTAGELQPTEAAEIAQTMGIKIYTIGVGTQGQAPIPVKDPFTGQRIFRWMQVNIDEKTLQEVAEKTGGQFFRATDTESLKKIYDEIDNLEKTKVETSLFTDYRELAVQDFQNSWFWLPPVLFSAFILFSVRQFLSVLWLRETI